MYKKSTKTFWAFLVMAFFLMSSTYAQDKYHNYSELTSELKSLNSANKNKTSLTSVAKSPGGKDIWLLTVGSGDLKNNPGIAVIGGAQGSHILGTELSLRFAKNLLSSDSEDLISNTTFYIFPQINPDAAQQYFADLKYERDGNDTSTDADRDGFYNEDGFDDLNGDGMITMMRVQDKTGDWTMAEGNESIMVKADPAKGIMGAYKLFTEGKDDDKDGKFNEDGVGGVNINQNFSFDFPYFKPGSSENPVSENETRGVLDFLFEEALNTFAVISFGPANNLSSSLKYNRGAASKRVVSGWLSDDIAINEMVSGWYNDITNLGKASGGSPQQGDLFQWAYYHYGRYSFSTPAWWTPEVKDEDGKAMKFDNDDEKHLAWAEANNQNAFVSWTEIDHPDFPNQKVEVGGFAPFSKSTPPAELLDSLSESHTDFILKVAENAPRIRLENMKIESAGRNLTRITVDVYNEGGFPTASELGQRNNWVRRVITQLQLSDGLDLVSGDIQSFDRSIAADGSITKTWLIRGNGTATIRAGSPMTGFSTKEQTIK